MRGRRCLLPEIPCHVTQRGVNRGVTFNAREDRETYLGLLRQNAAEQQVRILGWCLMTNHLHLILVPPQEESLSVLLRRVHGRYAQSFNARWGRSAHLWQNRFFSCLLAPDHLWAALAYVERHPVRAGMVPHAADYRWSSAAAHLAGVDGDNLLDMSWWAQQSPANWAELLAEPAPEAADKLRRCTFAGRPFGEEAWVADLAERFGRHWLRGRPAKNTGRPQPCEDGLQRTLF